MPHFDPRHDEYIAKAADFAQPILIHLRQLVHDTLPQVEESVKWSMPFYEYKGPICQMAAFKQHCTFGFWKGSLLADPDGILKVNDAMGSLGRITSLSDLPANDVLIRYLLEAADLNDKGIKVLKAKPTTSDKAALVIPDYLVEFLEQHPRAQKQFNDYGYSHKKEYVEWITEAKTEATRQKRMNTAVEWLNEGKSRHWKYQK